MKTMMILAAVFAAGILMTTGCSTSKSASNAKPATACDGSCCKDSAACAKCCTDAAGCAKCCKKS
jgi:hypothetical protein